VNASCRRKEELEEFEHLNPELKKKNSLTFAKRNLKM
jgi:hypothetical protein